MTSIHPRHHVRRRRRVKRVLLLPSLHAFQDRINNLHSKLAAAGINYSEVAAQQAAEMKIAALVSPHRLGAVMEEALRREEIIAQAAGSTEARLYHPRIGALHSVMDDLTQGRLA